MMNAEVLTSMQCWFAGGTAVAILLDEYRESVDVDFLCSDTTGYRMLREQLFDDGNLRSLFRTEPNYLREVRADQYGVRTVIEMDGVPIKFEIFAEGRIQLEAGRVGLLPVPVLTQADLFAETLLANADRWADRSTLSRDTIDLLMMESAWGSIPESAWSKVQSAYGHAAREARKKSTRFLEENPELTDQFLERMSVSVAACETIRTRLSHLR